MKQSDWLPCRELDEEIDTAPHVCVVNMKLEPIVKLCLAQRVEKEGNSQTGSIQ